MIITDGVHLTSTVNEEQLHRFAGRLGLKRRWFQDGRHPHYDLTTPAAKLRAVNQGAVLVSRRQLVRWAWWAPPSVDNEPTLD